MADPETHKFIFWLREMFSCSTTSSTSISITTSALNDPEWPGSFPIWFQDSSWVSPGLHTEGLLPTFQTYQVTCRGCLSTLYSKHRRPPGLSAGTSVVHFLQQIPRLIASITATLMTLCSTSPPPQTLSAWMSEHHLKLNPDETDLLFLPRKDFPVTDLHLHWQYSCCLGMTLDNKLLETTGSCWLSLYNKCILVQELGWVTGLLQRSPGKHPPSDDYSTFTTLLPVQILWRRSSSRIASPAPHLCTYQVLDSEQLTAPPYLPSMVRLETSLTPSLVLSAPFCQEDCWYWEYIYLCECYWYYRRDIDYRWCRSAQ